MAATTSTDLIENYVDANNNESANQPWQMWRKLRTMCEESPKLFLALEITSDLPSEDEVNRWLSEPIKCVIVPTRLFLTNKNGFPVLSKPHQRIIHQLLSVGFFNFLTF
jgi:protein arginine N-methyltransferase 5